MNHYKVKTTLYGELDIPSDNGIYEYFDISLNGRSMNVALNVSDGFLNGENIEIVHKFIEAIPVLYEKGRQKLLEIKNSNATVNYFMEYHLDELEEDMLEIFDVASVDKISLEMFIKRLSLRTVTIAPDANNEIDCTMDFSFPEDCSDELLVVRFDRFFEIYDISHES